MNASAAAGRHRAGRRGSESLPEEMFFKIFCLLPAREVASSCALVCRSWRVIASCDPLWKELCEGSGLKDVDAQRFRKWRALFGAVYGTNLIGGPHFERVDQIDFNRLKARTQRPCEPAHRLYPDCLYYENELHDEPHSFCHWSPDGGSRFQRGGGDGIVRECPPVGCAPCPGGPGKAVLATSYGWGKVYQSVDLSHFPRRFLDRSPPLLVSVWYAGKRGTLGMFKIQLGLRDKCDNIIVSCDDFLEGPIFSGISANFASLKVVWDNGSDLHAVLFQEALRAHPIRNFKQPEWPKPTFYMIGECPRLNALSRLRLTDISNKFSGELRAQPNKWREAKRLIHGYPKGMRSIVVKVSGMSLVNKGGFHGTKYSAVRMHFVAPAEVQANQLAHDELGELSYVSVRHSKS